MSVGDHLGHLVGRLGWLNSAQNKCIGLRSRFSRPIPTKNTCSGCHMEATRNAMDYIADMSNGLPGHIAEGELPLCLSAV